MIIDGRHMLQRDILLEIREHYAKDRCAEFDFSVLVASLEDARKVKGYTVMSGGHADVTKKDDYFVIHITGGTCRCG